MNREQEKRTDGLFVEGITDLECNYSFFLHRHVRRFVRVFSENFLRNNDISLS